jgi:hypothetical protein
VPLQACNGTALPFIFYIEDFNNSDAKILGPEGENVTGCWTNLHEDFQKFVRVTRHYEKDQIEKYVMGRTCILHQMHTILRYTTLNKERN